MEVKKSRAKKEVNHKKAEFDIHIWSDSDDDFQPNEISSKQKNKAKVDNLTIGEKKKKKNKKKDKAESRSQGSETIDLNNDVSPTLEPTPTKKKSTSQNEYHLKTTMSGTVGTKLNETNRVTNTNKRIHKNNSESPSSSLASPYYPAISKSDLVSERSINRKSSQGKNNTDQSDTKIITIQTGSSPIKAILDNKSQDMSDDFYRESYEELLRIPNENKLDSDLFNIFSDNESNVNMEDSFYDLKTSLNQIINNPYQVLNKKGVSASNSKNEKKEYLEDEFKEKEPEIKKKEIESKANKAKKVQEKKNEKQDNKKKSQNKVIQYVSESEVEESTLLKTCDDLDISLNDSNTKGNMIISSKDNVLKEAPSIKSTVTYKPQSKKRKKEPSISEFLGLDNRRPPISGLFHDDVIKPRK